MTLSCCKNISYIITQKNKKKIKKKNHGNFYCLNSHYSFRTENKVKSHEKVCKKKDLSGIVMPAEKRKKYNLINT